MVAQPTVALLFFIKKDNLKPPLQFRINNPDGTARDCTGDNVFFYMKKASTLKVNAGVCTPVDEANGVFEYRWAAGETDTSGTYRGEVKLNGEETFPTDGYMTIEIIDDLP